MSKSKDRNELEHLRGENRQLRSENRNLKKRLKQLERSRHIFEEVMDDAADDYLENEEMTDTNIPTDSGCEECGYPQYAYVDLGPRQYLICPSCKHRKQVIKKA